MQSREKFVLNNLDRREYRKIVAEKLKDVEFDQDKRIKLNDEELEYLLFDIDKTGKPIFAYPYEGLCKIDLSEVSFINVSFDSLDNIDLSNSNACINFDCALSDGKEHIYKNVNFTNIDLSNSYEYGERESLITFENCTFKGTNLKISDLQPAIFKNCDLSGLDLSNIELYSNGAYELVADNLSFKYCNLSNTKAKVYIGNFYKDDDYNEERAKEYLGILISKNYLDDCSVNDVYVKPKELQIKEAESILSEYNNYKRETLNNTLQTITTHSSSVGGRQINLKRITKNSEEENGNN